ncbi:hypothetical protein SAMN05444156_1083 [Verrucomicrobium sp. GAS474]|uniref:hypothetical protein n=1 Tax=Verrucomicrobium sp. GAS474 TaxID=1882831 RepID=UPI00087A5A1D|nr:hypothetical protein [Verrucomicrobium sp. GAS474]SDT96086.1 hypothetical protein SAMN05444156_1083 [Verrucomicrobium sp. GAS474]
MHRAALLPVVPFAALTVTLFAALFGGVVRAEARIGDTPMQIAARYGTGKVAGEQLLYTVTLKGVSYQDQIFFDAKGLVSMEIFSRKNPAADATSTPPADGGDDAATTSGPIVRSELAELTQADFDLLLAEEEGSVPWRSLTSTSEQQTWLSGNNRALARYQASNRLFLFLSPNARPFIPAGATKTEKK